MGIPLSTCGGSTPAPMAVDAMREGKKDPGQPPVPSPSGDDLHAPGQRLTPPRPRYQHICSLPTHFLLVTQSRDALQQGDQMSAIILLKGLDRGPHGACLYGTRLVLPHRRVAALNAGAPVSVNAM